MMYALVFIVGMAFMVLLIKISVSGFRGDKPREGR